MIWLGDVGQVFILYDGDTWQNLGGDIDTVLRSHSAVRARLGRAHGEAQSYTACAGHTSRSGVITAFVSDPDGGILSWSIVSQSYTPAEWSYRADLTFIGCP